MGAAVAMRLAGLTLLTMLLLSADSLLCESLRMGSGVSKTVLPVRQDKNGGVISLDVAWMNIDSLEVALMGTDEVWTDAMEEGLSRVPLNEVTPVGVANTTLVSVDHWSCTDRPRGLHPMSAAQVRLRVECFYFNADCNASYAPLQNNEPGRAGHYDRPPEWPTSHSSSLIECREVGPGQLVQRLSQHGVYADADNNDATPEGVENSTPCVEAGMPELADWASGTESTENAFTKRSNLYQLQPDSMPLYQRFDLSFEASPCTHGVSFKIIPKPVCSGSGDDGSGAQRKRAASGLAATAPAK